MNTFACRFSAVRVASARTLPSVVSSLCFMLATFPASAQYDLIHLGGAAGYYGEDVAVAGSHAFVASYTGGLRVYDISDPMNPQFVAATNTGISGVYDGSITIAGDYAYTGAIRDTDFHVYDISTPAHPFPVTNVFSGNYVAEIEVAGAVGYVANTTEGFSVYDFSSPSMPTRLTNFVGTSATCLALAGSYAYVGGGGMLRIYSLTDAFAPVEVGQTNSPAGAAIAVVDGYAFIGYSGGVAIFDVRNASSPVEVGPGLPIGRVEDMVVAEHYLFVANWSAGVRMYDISDPTQPLLIAQANTTGYAPASQGLCLSGNCIYVASGNTGFYVCAIMPRLQVSSDGVASPSISWPKPLASGVILEHCETLSGGDWTPMESEPVCTDGVCVLKPPTGSSGFYRLRMVL